MPVTMRIEEGREVHDLACAAEQPIEGQHQVNFVLMENNNPVTEMSVDAVLLGKPFFAKQMNLQERDEAESALGRMIPQIREQLHGIYHGTEPMISFLKKHRIRVEGTDPSRPIVHVS